MKIIGMRILTSVCTRQIPLDSNSLPPLPPSVHSPLFLNHQGGAIDLIVAPNSSNTE
jgi:hypothetical protein